MSSSPQVEDARRVGVVLRWAIKDLKIYANSLIIKGTRIPGKAIIVHYQSGMSSEDILEGYPSITPSQLLNALSYYHDHKEKTETINPPCWQHPKIDPGVSAPGVYKIEQFKEAIPDEVRSWETDPEKRYQFDELIREIKRECYHFMAFSLTEERGLRARAAVPVSLASALSWIMRLIF